METMTFHTAAEAAGFWGWEGWEAVGALATAAATMVALGLPYWDRRRARKLAAQIAGTVIAEEFRHVANIAESALRAVRHGLAARLIKREKFQTLPRPLDIEALIDLAGIILPAVQANQGLLLASDPATVASILDAHADIERQLRVFRDAFAAYRTAAEPRQGPAGSMLTDGDGMREGLGEMAQASNRIVAVARRACAEARILAKLGYPEEWEPNVPVKRDADQA